MEKIQDVTRSFDGSGNVENWIKKIRLVAKLKEVKKLESFLPLFLEGDAFADIACGYNNSRLILSILYIYIYIYSLVTCSTL